MIDFRKRLNKPEIEKKTNPIEIYDSLDRRSEAGPLRPAQQKILEEWYNSRRDEKDLIIKLHTGEGKTLIGLLMLQSKINSGEGPCLFICPNKYLVTQVRKEAKKFGITSCTFKEEVIGEDVPNEFLDGKKILITHVQKVFNGKTKFGLGNKYIPVENIILDDSHACIDSIRSAFTVLLGRNHVVYKKILELFEDALSEQGEGTFLEIKNEAYDSFLPIPYWSWIERLEEVLAILSEYSDEKSVKFAWPLIKNNLENCQAFISGKEIEISPIHIPIEKFSSFHKAKQRVLMSATTQDDSFFIKGLGFNREAVKKPLDNPEQIWSGEKMLIIPSLIDYSLDKDTMINYLAKPSQKNYGVVSLVTSFKKTATYEKMNALIAKPDEISGVVDHLKTKKFRQTVVFANRYDGIDLPDETCRILMFDGKPFFNSLVDRYEESNRLGSDSINIKIAQKIEQGLGRSVRGEKDYCLILIVGGDLIKFLRSSRTRKYFSRQTQKQIEIGMEIAQMASDEISQKKEPLDVVKSLMKQSLQRDEGWKEFYREEMNNIPTENEKSKIYDALTLERKAAVLNYKGDFEGASSVIQEIIDKYCDGESEKGWYLQIKARYQYKQSKTDSNGLQKAAFLRNHELLKPKEGISYRKLDYVHENRIKRITDWINNNNGFEELMLSVEEVLSNLEFGTSAEKFEAAFKELGTMLGFLSERPDKEVKRGPDNLWCGVSNEYFIFECKSEVNIDRNEINKHEASQMNTHCGWFDNHYSSAPVKRILITPTKNLASNADFTHEVEIMRKNKLKLLRVNVKAFFREFHKYEIDSLTDEKVQEFLNEHKLDVINLRTIYSEPYKTNSPKG